MKCPYCGSDNTRTTDSRINENRTLRRRRHRCNNCQKTFGTIEMHDNEYDKVMAFKAMLEAFSKGFSDMRWNTESRKLRCAWE